MLEEHPLRHARPETHTCPAIPLAQLPGARSEGVSITWKRSVRRSKKLKRLQVSSCKATFLRFLRFIWLYSRKSSLTSTLECFLAMLTNLGPTLWAIS